MKWLIVIAVVMSSAVYAEQPAQQVRESAQSYMAVNPVDQEMIMLLQLRDDQIGGYLDVILRQRQILLAIPDSRWQKRLAVYEETFDKLKSVLDEAQFAWFTAYVGCLIEEEMQHELHLAME